MTIDLGTDISTPDAADIDPFFGLVSGLRGLAQALARRMVTPRGSLLDDDSYGYDLRSRLNDNLKPADLSALGTIVQRELEADERVESATISLSLAGDVLRVVARIVASVGAFRLVLAVSAVTVEILAAEPL